MNTNQYRFKDGFIIYELLWIGYLTEIYFQQKKTSNLHELHIF